MGALRLATSHTGSPLKGSVTFRPAGTGWPAAGSAPRRRPGRRRTRPPRRRLTGRRRALRAAPVAVRRRSGRGHRRPGARRRPGRYWIDCLLVLKGRPAAQRTQVETADSMTSFSAATRSWTRQHVGSVPCPCDQVSRREPFRHLLPPADLGPALLPLAHRPPLPLMRLRS